MTTGKLRWGIPLALLMVASVVPRVPLLYNAAHNFSSDEAVNALVILRLMQHREIVLFNWDATYYGIVEGLLAIPFLPLAGFGPLAFKLGSLVGFLVLLAAAFEAARRLYGLIAAVATGALLVVFSPQLVLWSTTASGGYCLVVAWGVVTLLAADRVLDTPTLQGFALLGLSMGFGLYIYQLYLVFASLIGVAVVAAVLSAWRRGVGIGRLSAATALLGTGILVGWSPFLIIWARGELGGKQPSYELATLPRALANFDLMMAVTAPALLGANPRQRPELDMWVGNLPPAASWVLLVLPAIAWAWGARRVSVGLLRRERPWLELLVVLLLPWTAVLYLLSANPTGPLSSRYLLPWVASLTILMGGLLARLYRRSSLLAATLLVVTLGLATAQLVSWYRDSGHLGRRLELVRIPDPLEDVLAYLRQHDVRGAYSWYWAAYRATALARERLIVAPLDDWDRFPLYTAHVDALPRVAYVLQDSADPELGQRSDWLQDRLRNRLESAGVVPMEARFAVYTVLHGRNFAPLLGPRRFAPRPLAIPRADITLLEAPSEVEPGELLRLRVEVVNRSDAGWSATGDPLLGGAFAVAAAYRWYGTDGSSLVENPERSYLPADLAPGEALELRVRAPAPQQPGRYALAITLVQENSAWFDLATGSRSPPIAVEVLAPPDATDQGARPADPALP